MGDEPTDDIPEMVRSLRRGLRKAERILNRDEQLAGLFVIQDLAEARVEVARLRLPLQCGEKLTSGEKLTWGIGEGASSQFSRADVSPLPSQGPCQGA
jgi:hypothetical protein